MISMHKALAAGDGKWTILIRLLLAGVFIPEGIQKLIFPEILGAGRFARIGIPYSDFTGPLVGGFEVICGALLLIGALSRLAAIPIIVIMIVAIVSTKIPIALGRDWLFFHVAHFDRYGWWSMLHEIRTDWAMLMGALFVLLSGGGRWSLDQILFRPPSS
jgi:uncharacterized membrane protein YphA (DoxX/SURF4 family)